MKTKKPKQYQFDFSNTKRERPELPDYVRACKGPLHNGEKISTTLFVSARSWFCRECQREIDKQRGNLRGEPRTVRSERLRRDKLTAAAANE